MYPVSILHPLCCTMSQRRVHNQEPNVMRMAASRRETQISRIANPLVNHHFDGYQVSSVTGHNRKKKRRKRKAFPHSPVKPFVLRSPRRVSREQRPCAVPASKSAVPRPAPKIDSFTEEDPVERRFAGKLEKLQGTRLASCFSFNFVRILKKKQAKSTSARPISLNDRKLTVKD